MKLKTYNTKQVSKWFVDNLVMESSKVPTYIEVQAFLYFAKCFSYAFCNESFFDCQIIKKDNLLLTKEFNDYMTKYNYTVSQKLFQDEPLIADSIVNIILRFVFEKLKNLSDEQIVEILKNEALKLNLNSKTIEISNEIIYSYSQDVYLSDTEKNNLGISRKEIIMTINEINLIKYKKAFKVLAK